MQPHHLVGDCGEYSSLFVTMCRIAGIPARNETGFVLFPETKNVIEHGWASIYLETHGWMTIDTQWAQIEKNEGRDPLMYFFKQPDYRIIFTHGFNVLLTPSIPEQWYPTYKKYWKNQCLPITINSVQTLQPLIFTADNEIKFSDEISFE
jgi:transglutaminase/protease-like cytokinesis protein 3